MDLCVKLNEQKPNFYDYLLRKYFHIECKSDQRSMVCRISLTISYWHTVHSRHQSNTRQDGTQSIDPPRQRFNQAYKLFD